MKVKLSEANLFRLKEHLVVPTYNRKEISTGIVHVGVGGFHRAHQAVVIQQLIEMGGHNEWGVCGIGLREADREIADVFQKQDNLYTLITRHPKGMVKSQVMGQMTDFLLASNDKQVVIDRMAHPETRIISLTITEGGYHLKPDGTFDVNSPEIQYELQNPEDPLTIFGFLYAALKKRNSHGHPPFTILSCDNIQHNGDVAKKMLLSFVSLHNESFSKWIAQEVSFPNSMVDRITPATTPAELDYLKDQFDLEDEWPVTCEPFLQWVIEDNFTDGRPDFDLIEGVQFVPDVTPYEKMKISLLNAGHSLLGIFGALMGIQDISSCMANKLLLKVLRKFWVYEVQPVLDEVEGIDIHDYMTTLEERFANLNIKDKVSRICSESSAKLPKFLIPTLIENLEKGGTIEITTMLIAAWCKYSDKQVDCNGLALEITDAMAEELHDAAQKSNVDPSAFLNVKAVFGDLVQNKTFTKTYVEKIRIIYKNPDFSQHLENLVK